MKKFCIFFLLAVLLLCSGSDCDSSYYPWGYYPWDYITYFDPWAWYDSFWSYDYFYSPFGFDFGWY